MERQYLLLFGTVVLVYALTVNFKSDKACTGFICVELETSRARTSVAR